MSGTRQHPDGDRQHSLRADAELQPNESSVTNNRGGFWTGEDAADCHLVRAEPRPRPAGMPTAPRPTTAGSVVDRRLADVLCQQSQQPPSRVRRCCVCRSCHRAQLPIDLIRRPPAAKRRQCGVRAAVFRHGQPAHPAVGSPERHHQSRDGDRHGAGAARWRLEGHASDRATGPSMRRILRSRARWAPATNTVHDGHRQHRTRVVIRQIASPAAFISNFLAPWDPGRRAGTTMWITSTLGTVSVTNCTARTPTPFTGCTVGALWEPP